MKRRTFSEILQSAQIDLHREYDRLYDMFFMSPYPVKVGGALTLRDFCAANFLSFPYCDTCVTLEDFDDFYKFHFERSPSEFDINYLISFCEYTFNFLISFQSLSYQFAGQFDPIAFFTNHVSKVIEKIGYMENDMEGIFNIVPKSAPAIAVSEIVHGRLSYDIIEYNHHSMRGDISKKKDILYSLANKLEPDRPKLKQINATMDDHLFFLFNNMNIRHNNSDKNSKHYNEYVANMTPMVLEQWYDEIYQLCLLAFLELDNLARKSKVANLKKAMNP